MFPGKLRCLCRLPRQNCSMKKEGKNKLGKVTVDDCTCDQWPFFFCLLVWHKSPSRVTYVIETIFTALQAYYVIGTIVTALQAYGSF